MAATTEPNQIHVAIKEPEELDLDEPIQKWAKFMFRKSMKKVPKRCQISLSVSEYSTEEDSDCESVDGVDDNYDEDSDVIYEINKDKLRIRTEKPEFCSGGGLKADVNVTTQAIFETKYTNETYESQSFSFKVARETESVATVHMNRMITAASLKILSIPLPEELQTAGFGKVLQPTKAVETFKKEIRWSVDNLVVVPPKKYTTASLVITENEYRKDFTVKLTIKGKVLVNIIDRKTKDCIRYLEGDIVEIMIAHGGLMEGLSIQQDKKCIEFQTKGKCNFAFGVKQDVALKTQDYREKTCMGFCRFW